MSVSSGTSMRETLRHALLSVDLKASSDGTVNVVVLVSEKDAGV